MVESINQKIDKEQKSDFNALCSALKSEMISIFENVHTEVSDSNLPSLIENVKKDGGPQVWMIVGVNGAGKTTSIGKLSKMSVDKGYKTLVVAGDTYRAAAEKQLEVWSERAGVEIFSPEGVKDPSAVCFDGCQMAKAKNYDVVILDTAGRLHTQSNLMEELIKMKRVVKKVIPDAPHEVLIVLDSNSGQNALQQADKFNEALGLTGAVLTKLDGTAKGGVAVGLACEFEIPIRAIGVGEGIEDLRPFDPKEFVDSIL